jgi:hypothetical protein
MKVQLVYECDINKNEIGGEHDALHMTLSSLANDLKNADGNNNTIAVFKSFSVVEEEEAAPAGIALCYVCDNYYLEYDMTKIEVELDITETVDICNDCVKQH